FCPAITSETLRLIAFRLLLCSVFKGQFLLLRKRFVRISNVYKYTKIFAFRQYFLQSFLNKDEKRWIWCIN
ncbi:hypothetical protein, partial [Listeria monocytogenes]|uniref:hypothetical protein n=1 Tax=Listeria monocytogenes TaxID=1639 RepID=UPI001A9C4F55